MESFQSASKNEKPIFPVDQPIIYFASITANDQFPYRNSRTFHILIQFSTFQKFL